MFPGGLGTHLAGADPWAEREIPTSSPSSRLPGTEHPQSTRTYFEAMLNNRFSPAVYLFVMHCVWRLGGELVARALGSSREANSLAVRLVIPGPVASSNSSSDLVQYIDPTQQPILCHLVRHVGLWTPSCRLVLQTATSTCIYTGICNSLHYSIYLHVVISCTSCAKDRVASEHFYYNSRYLYLFYIYFTFLLPFYYISITFLLHFLCR